ncbi:MAG: hypothetical protein EA423_07995 [Phycisphaerales bacterium]|nr:hypothetical protein [Phycisphaerales bacterium]TVS03878.1 MAG: hypothetical protein EA423_07995 [Phycisphaerales bacterium]
MTERREVELIRKALDAVKADWKTTPKIVEIRFEIGDDHTGDPAVDVLVLIDNATKDEDWTSENLDPIADRVREEIEKLNIDRLVHVGYRRPDDLAEAAGRP